MSNSEADPPWPSRTRLGSAAPRPDVGEAEAGWRASWANPERVFCDAHPPVNVPPPRNVWTPDTLRGGGVILYGLIEKLSRRDALTPEEAAALREVLGPLQRVAAGTDIVREGARPEHSTLLTSGFTARYSTLADGGRQITELNVSGDFVDLHSFMMKQMDHGVVALTECVIAPAPHVVLRRLTEEHPHLTRLLWLDTVIDAAIHRQWIASMGRRSALAHLAHLVCELYKRLEVVRHATDCRFELPLSQAVLADVLGLSTVHVNRLVADLRARNILTWGQGRIEILDWDRLAELAEFDPAFLRLQREPV
jgi:CRP-like cAMP-binding protein